MSTTQQILDLLNTWEADHKNDEPWNGANIWNDVIVGIATYDEAATDDIDEGSNDRFMTSDGVEFYFDGSRGEWVAQ